MTKEQIQAEISKVQSNKFLPQAVKDLKIKKLNAQLKELESAGGGGAKKGPTIVVAKPGVGRKDFLEKYKGDVYDALEDLMQITRSDAQGIADAHEALIEKEYDKGTTAKATAKLIDKIGQEALKKDKASKAAKKAPKKPKSAKKGKGSPVQILIDELTDIGIDADDEDETLIASFRMELEDNKADKDKIEDVIGEFKIGPKIQDEKIDKEVQASIKKYYKNVPEPAMKKSKAKKPQTEYRYKGRHIKELTKEDCDELAKEIRERRAKQKKAEKKSKSKPVIEKIAKNVATSVKQAIKNVSAADIKDDPKKELDKMARIEKAAKTFLAELRSILGDDYDKDAIEGEFKEVHDLIKGLKSKYGK